MRLVSSAALICLLSLPAQLIHGERVHPCHRRAALCFFGQVKNINQSHVANFIDNVMMPILEIYPHVDVYLHTYNIQTFTNPRNGEHDVPVRVATSIARLTRGLSSCPLCTNVHVKGMVVSAPTIADSRFRNLQYYLARGDPWNNQGLSMRYFLRQLYSLDTVTRLWSKEWIRNMTSDYGIVVYTRPDLFFFDRLSLGRGNSMCDIGGGDPDGPFILQPETIYTPGFDVFGGLNDRFALGVPSVMKVYGRRMHLIDHYFEENLYLPLWSEPFLHDIMVSMWGFRSAYLQNFRFARVRADGSVGLT